MRFSVSPTSERPAKVPAIVSGIERPAISAIGGLPRKRKSTTIARKLRDVETLPQPEADRILIGAEDDLFDADPEFDGEAASPAPAD